MVVLFVRIPRPWKERLQEMADQRSLSLSAVHRALLYDQLYDRPTKDAA